MDEVIRGEYPRPQFVRADWMPLNGEWEFSFDEERYDRKIVVPFAYEAPLSGIGERAFHDTVWYRRTFEVPEKWRGKRVLLHFGAVDYECDVWVNGSHTVRHVGGQLGFSADITEQLIAGVNTLRVRARDDHSVLDIPRGKQFWKEESESIFYTATTGIWQSVWLEPVCDAYIEEVRITPLYDEKAVRFEYRLAGGIDGAGLKAELSFSGRPVAQAAACTQSAQGAFSVSLEETALGIWNAGEELVWTPETPRLFDVTFRLVRGGEVLDEAGSYFGMRKVSVENGRFLLNNRPYYQRLLLDQGYWPDGGLTAPSDEAFAEDIRLAKAMGFNGVRKHQKVEDPRFLYHADRIGLLVWGEIGSGYTYSNRFAGRLMEEWVQAVQRDYNHPCIVVWTPLNESWGVQEIAHAPCEQEFCRAMAAMTKALDGTRPVSDNDGWEHVGGDLLTIHDYEAREEVLAARYRSAETALASQPAARPLYVQGSGYRGEPILVSEFGGISFAACGENGWGYSTAQDKEDFLRRYEAVICPMLDSPCVQGFCYTQLTDVEQEINGLLTYDRQPKADLEKIRRITCGEDRCE